MAIGRLERAGRRKSVGRKESECEQGRARQVDYVVDSEGDDDGDSEDDAERRKDGGLDAVRALGTWAGVTGLDDVRCSAVRALSAETRNAANFEVVADGVGAGVHSRELLDGDIVSGRDGVTAGVRAGAKRGEGSAGNEGDSDESCDD